MMRLAATPPWFDRSFNFPVAPAMLPSLCARLRGTPARLEEVLRGASSQTLVHKPGDAWSAQENAGHLADLEPLWIARLEDFRSRNPQLTPADLNNRKTHDSDHNARSLDEILETFRELRRQLLAAVDALREEDLGGALLHPRLGVPMRATDHLYFVAEHDDHHLARIWNLLGHAS